MSTSVGVGTAAGGEAGERGGAEVGKDLGVDNHQSLCIIVMVDKRNVDSVESYCVPIGKRTPR